MPQEGAVRDEWKKTIRQKTEQVVRDYSIQHTGEIALHEALVGVLAECYRKKGVPRALVKKSEGATHDGLVCVFDRILSVMRTPTYSTVNYTNPEAVELANELCLKGSITGGYADRDATYVLSHIIGEKNWHAIYWDDGREYPQYAGNILEKLNEQFGSAKVASALKEYAEFSRILKEEAEIADSWERAEDLKNGTTGMDVKSRIELGFAQLQDGFNSMEEFNRTADRERTPYRRAQYKLRGIPLILHGTGF